MSPNRCSPCLRSEQVWRRAAPTLRIRAPHKDEKMAAIHKALDECSTEHHVFYEDEVDIHLNPKIGAEWQLRRQQGRVVTLRKNENTIWPQHYLVSQEKSATSGITVKARRCSYTCRNIIKLRTDGQKPSRVSWITTLSTKAMKPSAG